MIIRSGRYEVKQIDDWNWGVFKVYPDASKAPRSKVTRRTADDGKVLLHTGTYHGTLASALRRAHQLMLADGAASSEFETLADLVEDSEQRVSDMAEAVSRAIPRKAKVR